MARGYDDEYEDYDDHYDDRPPPGLRPPFPATVMTAGVIWLVNGGLILLGGLIFLYLAVFVARVAAGAPGAGAIIGGLACAYVIVAIFGAAFILVGVQTVRGTARDTLGNAIGSLAAVGATGLLLAGILALVGREQYRHWKYGDRPPPRRRRRQPPPDEYDDDY